MRVVATRLQDMVAFPWIAPFQNLNGDAANSPIVHFASGRTVKVNGVPARQSPAIVVHLVNLTGGEDQEFGAGRPPGPVGGCTPDGPGFESRANGVGFAVPQMITFGVGVSGGAYFHKVASWQWRLVFRKRALSTTGEEDRHSRASDQANNSKLHARQSYRDRKKE
jgi:hypothetical protein